MKFFGINPRIWVRFWCVGFSALALWLIFRRIDAQALREVLQEVRLGWLIAAFLLFALGTVLAACRWHVALHAVKSTVHPTATLRTVFIGHFFNTLLLGPAGGDLAKSALYGRWFRYPIPTVLAGSFLDRLFGGGGHILFIIVALLLLAGTVPLDFSGWFQIPDRQLWLGAALVLFVFLGGFLARRRLRTLKPLVNTKDAFIAGVKQMRTMPRLALLGLGFSFFVQVSFCGVLALCLQAVTQESLPWVRLLWTFPVISLISGAPIAVAGAGIREGAALVFLGMYGISETDAVAAALLTLLIFMVWAVVGGLVLWRQETLFRRHAREVPRTISLVIPTLNEAQALPVTVQIARKIPEICEIIVVDGGSQDETAAIAESLGCQVIQSAPSRGAQMRTGAAQASGDVILLLHADTWLPPDAGAAILGCLRDVTVVGGGFWKVFDRPTPMMLGSRFRCALRIWIWGRVAGDQAMFMRRAVLEEIGGVPDMPLMEEFELCKRLRKAGRLALAGGTVITSTRRFAKLGVFRTYVRMWRVTLGYYMGTSSQKLQRLYERF